jgi:hypothetical protein
MQKFNGSTLKQGTIAVALIIGIMAALLIVGTSFSKQPSAPHQPQLEPFGRAACTPGDVTVYAGSRIHIRCLEAVSGSIIYFAVGTGDTDADKLLSILNVAIANPGLKVVVDYIDSSASNPAGCNVGDCRRLVTVSLQR